MKILRRLLPAPAVAALLLVLPGPAAIDYPWKDVYIGALDGPNWCGLVLAASKDAGFGFRFRVTKDGLTADGKDLFYMVSEVGPNAPDNSYARVRFDLGLPVLPADRKGETPILVKPSAKSDTLTLEWSRQDERTVIGRVQGPKGADLELVPYFPWDDKGTFRIGANGGIEVDMAGTGTAAGLIWTDRTGAASPPAPGEGPILGFPPTDDRVVYFVAGVGESLSAIDQHVFRFKNKRLIESLLAEEEDRYARKRVRIDGLFEGVAGSDHEQPLLDGPLSARPAPPLHAGRPALDLRPARRRAGPLADLRLGFLLQRPRAGRRKPRARLRRRPRRPRNPVPERQHPQLAQPLRRDARPLPASGRGLRRPQALPADGRHGASSRPPIPSSPRWHAFWKARKPTARSARDGNGDGLLEWGSDRELVAEKVPAWEVGRDGRAAGQMGIGPGRPSELGRRPGRDAESGTLTMNCLDLNCLYALDAWCLSQIADILGRARRRPTSLPQGIRADEGAHQHPPVELARRLLFRPALGRPLVDPQGGLQFLPPAGPHPGRSDRPG